MDFIQIFAEKYSSLPFVKRMALLSDTLGTRVYEIGQKYGVAESKLDNLLEITGLVILEAVPQNQLDTELVAMGILPDTAKEMGEELATITANPEQFLDEIEDSNNQKEVEIKHDTPARQEQKEKEQLPQPSQKSETAEPAQGAEPTPEQTEEQQKTVTPGYQKPLTNTPKYDGDDPYHEPVA